MVAISSLPKQSPCRCLKLIYVFREFLKRCSRAKGDEDPAERIPEVPSQGQVRAALSELSRARGTFKPAWLPLKPGPAPSALGIWGAKSPSLD